MNLATTPYLEQHAHWPQQGRHILAHFTEATVVVYQAYRQEIGHFAATHGRFGDGFSLSRMSWIKPNFLWMMYRSAWGTAAGQEVVLAVTLQRAAFDSILARAVPSTFDAMLYPDVATWQSALQRSDVVVQWDPDHTPSGAKTERRALQLGLRGATLAAYAQDWIARIADISSFVAEQRAIAQRGDYALLLTPREDVYPVAPTVAQRLGMAY
jgi:hypothetical protein